MTFRGRPVWLWITAITTLIYLIVEFAFNARLLDIIGTDTAAEIDSIEHWGRVISGCALALALWPLLIKGLGKIATPIAAAVSLIIVSGLVIAVVYIAEEKLVESIAAGASASQKAKAPDLELLQRAIKNRDVNLAGIETSSIDEPATKAFFAVFPVLALHIDELESLIAADKIGIVKKQVLRQYGGLQGAYDSHSKSLVEIWNLWNRYAEASNDYFDTIDEIGNRQASAWTDYKAILKDRGFTTSFVPFFAQGKVRREVQANGIPVPDDWKPSDRAGFNRAVKSRIEAEAKAGFAAGLTAFDASLSAVPPGLSLKKFTELPVLQSMWRERLSYPHGIALKAYETNRGPTLEEFQRDILAVVVSARTAEAMRILDAEESEFDEGGRYQEEGRAYIMKLIAPVIALTLSFIGAIVHVFKLGGLIAQLIAINPIPAWKKCTSVMGAAALVVMIFSTAITTSITRSELYSELHEVMARGADNENRIGQFIAATLIRGAINAQPVLYAVSRGVAPLIPADLTRRK